MSPGLPSAPAPQDLLIRPSPPGPHLGGQVRGGLPVYGGSEGSPPGKMAAKEPCQPRLIIPVISANSFPGQPLQGRFQEQLTVIILNPPTPLPSPSPARGGDTSAVREAPQVAARVLQGPSDPAQPWWERGEGRGLQKGRAGSPWPAPPAAPQGVPAPNAAPAPCPPALSVSQRPSMPSQASDDRKEEEARPHLRDKSLRLGDHSGVEWSQATGRVASCLTGAH